jgi:hypothetical protein
LNREDRKDRKEILLCGLEDLCGSAFSAWLNRYADRPFNGLSLPFASPRVQLEVGLNKSSAESAEQQSPGRKPWDQA